FLLTAPPHTVTSPLSLHAALPICARLDSAAYGLGWRVYEYEGHRVAYHAGAVQGYRGMIAVVPELELGIALMWNGESTIPSSMLDRKSTRLNSSHVKISYAVFCLK